MVQNPPEGYQCIIPYLLYADAPAACDFLCTAFGFTERFRFEMGEGHTWFFATHARDVSPSEMMEAYPDSED